MTRDNSGRLKAAREAMEKMKESGIREDLGEVHSSAVTFEGKPIKNIPLDSLRPAPMEWNFFPPISEGKMLEMMLSIQENGLFNPIITWEKDGKYMILSGHNRVEAFHRIISEYGELDTFDADEYRKIPAIVYEAGEIDEVKAREIIIDTNYIQREEDKRLMPIIIKNRMDITKNRKDKKGRTVEVVAKEMGLSKTKVYEDYVIGTQIIPELQELFYQGIITKKALLKFAWYNRGIQEHLHAKHRKNITNSRMVNVKKNMRKKELDELFSDKEDLKTVLIQVRIPEKHKEAFRQMVDQWILLNVK